MLSPAFKTGRLAVVIHSLESLDGNNKDMGAGGGGERQGERQGETLVYRSLKG